MKVSFAKLATFELNYQAAIKSKLPLHFTDLPA
jgi:hypothetical protein